MSASGFTPQQRRVVLLLVIAVVFVFAMLTGFVITSLRNLSRNPAPAPTLPSVISSPTPLPTPMASPTANPTPVEGIQSQVQAARLFDQVAHQVENLRELSPRAEVPLSFLDERGMTTMLREIYVERDPQARLRPYIALELLPSAPISLQVDPAAGIYVPEQKQLYISTGHWESGGDSQALLAHAYAHALQDQRFDLEAVYDRATTSDADLAVEALVEGDATLLTALYSYEDLAEADWSHLSSLIVDAEKPDYGEALRDSGALRRLQHFPNRAGRRFAQAIFQAGGWEAVNQAYTTPPRSTEQVLHPKRYIEELDSPATVVVPDLKPILGEDWSLSLEDTLGEFVVGLYLKQALPGERAWQAADGWDGDTFVVWERKNGRRLLIWRTVWDSTAEAAEFERALAAMIPQRYFPVGPVDAPEGLSGHWWAGDAGAMHVRRTARYVLFVKAPDVNTLTNVAGSLP